jgi:hypothetical protein
MMTDTQPSPGKAESLDRFHEIELEKTLDAILANHTFRVQAGVFFGTVNLAALGIALSSRGALVVFFAALLPLMLIVVDTAARVSLATLYYRLHRLVKRFAPGDLAYLESLPGSEAEWAGQMAAEEELDTRGPHVGRVPMRSLTKQSVLGFWMPAALSLGQVGLALVLWLVVGWPLLGA